MRNQRVQNSLPPLLSPAPLNYFSSSNRVVHHIKHSLALTQTEFSTDSPFNHLTISTKLGQGAFGVTFQVQDTNGSNYAIKKTSRLRSGLQEAHNQSKINSETVVQTTNAWTESGQFFIQMECCERNIADFKFFDESVILTLAADISKALLDIHALKLLHLDVKPDNILIRQISNQNQISTPVEQLSTPRESNSKLNFNSNFHSSEIIFQLADFGNSTGFGAVDAQPGDARYLDPAFMQTLVPDENSDVFSLGATLYEIATETKLAKEGEEFKRFRENCLREKEFPGFKYSKELYIMIQQLLSKKDLVEWREEWKKKGKLPDRTEAYQKVREQRRKEICRVVYRGCFGCKIGYNKMQKLLLRLKRTGGKYVFAVNNVIKYVPGNRNPKFEDLTEKEEIVENGTFSDDMGGFEFEGCDLSANGLDLSF